MWILGLKGLKELRTKSALCARGPHLFDMHMPSSSLHPSREFSGASATRFLQPFSSPPFLSSVLDK